MRIVRNVSYAASYEESLRRFESIANPAESLVLTAESGPPSGDVSAGDEVDVTSFSANRVVARVKAGSPGWLFYADAFHPGWKATVNETSLW